MSSGLWIWDDAIRTVAFDTAGARRLLSRRQLPPVDILVPASSGSRRQLAQIVQAAWRRIGVDATITIVDFPVFQERLAAGKFDSYIGVYLDEPSPRGLADQWTRAGWEGLNHGRYHNPRFDSLLAAGFRPSDPIHLLAVLQWRSMAENRARYLEHFGRAVDAEPWRALVRAIDARVPGAVHAGPSR